MIGLKHNVDLKMTFGFCLLVLLTQTQHYTFIECDLPNKLHYKVLNYITQTTGLTWGGGYTYPFKVPEF